MKFLLSAACAMALVASSAVAQPAAGPATPTTPTAATPVVPPSQCTPLQPEPTFPDGATATGDQITAAETQYQAWSEASRTSIQCMRHEYEALVAEATARRELHNQMAARLNALTNAWVVERDEYCARPRTHCQQTPQ